ncbi:MAG: SDR family oxidoreductase [Bacteroidota bacterium]
MNILVIGSTGRLGTMFAAVALNQGHQLTAFARKPETFPFSHENLRLVKGDVLEPAGIEAAVQGMDVVVSAVGIRQFRGTITLLSSAIKNIITVMEAHGPRRLLTITGAGILQENPKQLIMESLSFPPNLQNISMDHRRVYEALEASSLDWTIVAPAFMHRREKAGQYRVRDSYYPKSAQNEVSVEEVADFMMSEIGHGQFIGKRVGIASALAPED